MPTGQQSGPTSLGSHVGLLLLCGAALLHAFYFGHTCDDAYISFRYAHNLVRGQGLVFNPGEYVMGYSNLAWVVLIALFEWLGVPGSQAAPILGSVCALATVVLIHRHLLLSHGSQLPALAAAALLATNGVFALWMFGGLEGHLFTLALTSLLLATVASPQRRPPRTAFLLGLGFGSLSLIRPEGVMFAGPTLLFWCLRKDRRPSLRAVIAFVAGAAVVVASLAAWIWSYYGSWLPNTYHAKDHSLSFALLDRGVSLTLRYVKAYWGLPVIVPLVWLVTIRRRESNDLGWLSLLVMLTSIGFYLRIGGDLLVYYRFWLPSIALMALMVGDILAGLRPHRSKWPSPLALSATSLLLIASLSNSLVGADIDYLRKDERRLRDIRMMAEHFRDVPADWVIATNVVGILGYHSEHRILDMLGLTDAHIARAPSKPVGIPGHESHDGAYVLSRQPEIILPGFPLLYEHTPSESEVMERGYPSDEDLYRQPGFCRDYHLRCDRLGDGRSLPYFLRNEHNPSTGEIGKTPRRP